MASLPEARITPLNPPFTFVGVDYFGPFMVSQGRGQVKRYGSINQSIYLNTIKFTALLMWSCVNLPDDEGSAH
jgi:hypothetical protein